MWWNLAPILIAISSIMISIYVFKIAESKRGFWSILALSSINLLGGWLMSIYINFIIGLTLFLIPVLILLYGFLKYKKVN